MLFQVYGIPSTFCSSIVLCISFALIIRMDRLVLFVLVILICLTISMHAHTLTTRVVLMLVDMLRGLIVSNDPVVPLVAAIRTMCVAILFIRIITCV